jgi:SanA protein
VDEAILVTQLFHLPRALYTCSQLGLKAIGVPSDQSRFSPQLQAYWYLREVPATLTAFFEVNFTHPLPVLGDPEPIFSKT